MSSTELKLIDEFLNFKDFSNSKNGSKNQELGPWGTPQGDQDIFCYRKRLEETSALTNKATKKQLKPEIQSPKQLNEGLQIPQDHSLHNSLLLDPCNTTSSNLLQKNKKQIYGLTYQMSQTSQRPDFLGNQENKLYQSAEIDTSYYLKKGIQQIKKKDQSVGRGTTVFETSSLLPTSESSTLKYEKDLDKIKQVLKDQNESQKCILAQGNTRDMNIKLLENYSSTLALMPEGNLHQQMMIKTTHSNNLTQQNLNRSKRNAYEQKRVNSKEMKNSSGEENFENSFNKKHFLLIENQRPSAEQKNYQNNIQMMKDIRTKKIYPQSNGYPDAYNNYINYADPKQRINSIRQQLNLFEEGKKKFEKVLKISRLSSMTPEQPVVQKNDLSIKEIRQKISKTNRQNIEKKKNHVYDIPADRLHYMLYGTKNRIDSDISTISMLENRQNSFHEINNQFTTNPSVLIQPQDKLTHSSQKDVLNQKVESNKHYLFENNKLPRLSNNNSNLRGIKNRIQQRNKPDNPLNEYYQSNASPSSLANKLDLTKVFQAKKIIHRASNIS